MSVTLTTPRRRKASLFDAALNANWPAANDLSVGQINGLDSPLSRESLTLEHVKPQLLGHWGTTPAQNLINNEREAT
jgi:phosphoketolase